MHDLLDKGKSILDQGNEKVDEVKVNGPNLEKAIDIWAVS